MGELRHSSTPLVSAISKARKATITSSSVSAS